MCLHALVGKYEYDMEEDREPLFDIINYSFKLLGGLINYLITKTDSDIALSILYLICKVFYTSN